MVFLSDDEDIMGKTVNCVLKNDMAVIGTVTGWDDDSIDIKQNLTENKIILSLDYIGALFIL